MASTTTKLMTFEEFQQVPDPPGGRYELLHGELVLGGHPQFPHVRAQRQLRRLLERSAGDAGIAHTEMPYRPLPEYEGWRADVAYLSKEPWNSIDRYLMCSPELVIEVLSPSSSAAEMLDKRTICLVNGAREFWVVVPDHRLVEVSTPDGHTTTYKPGQRVPLFLGGEIAVDSIFATDEA